MESNHPKKQTGFTLMEMLVYISVLTIIFISVSSFLLWAIKSNNKNRAEREVLDNARRAVEVIVHEVKEAKGIYTPTASSTQLSLETIKYLPAGEEASYIDFYLCGAASSTLCFKKEDQAPVALTSEKVEIDELEFTLVATTTPSVEINLTISYKTSQTGPENQASTTLKTTASLRSY